MARKETRQITLLCKNPNCPELKWTETISVATNDGLIDGKHLDSILERRRLRCPHCGNTNKKLINPAPMIVW